MPVQQQMSSFAKNLGGQVAQANAEHADKPVDTGNRRLPAGIRDGVAKLSTMYTKEYEDDKAGMKGSTFFRASALVVQPIEHNGERVAGLVTSTIIPLCKIPAKIRDGKKVKDEVPFSQNWFDFQNLFKLLGVYPPDGKDGRPDYTDRAIPDRVAASLMIEAYYFAAMKTLTDPIRVKTNPVYITFSTRAWTPPTTGQNQKPEPMVFETWHGLADTSQWNGQVASGGVNEVSALPPQPGSMEAPPTQTSTQRAASPPTTTGPSPQYQPDDDGGAEADGVPVLVETAMDDPEGATEEGAAASAQLEELAWAAGWSKEQTAAAADWAAVGEMALSGPETGPPPSGKLVGGVTVGQRWLFAKRTKDGEKLKSNRGEEFPSLEVEVVTVDAAAQTCTVKSARDGKPVVDIRSKQPITVKWEWLEALPY